MTEVITELTQLMEDFEEIPASKFGWPKGKPRGTQDLTGQKFGLLTAVRFEYMRDKPPRAYWTFACECGGSVVARASNVKYGTRASCGCVRGKRIPGPLSRAQQYRRSHERSVRPEQWQEKFKRLVDSPAADPEWAAAYLERLVGRPHE